MIPALSIFFLSMLPALSLFSHLGLFSFYYSNRHLHSVVIFIVNSLFVSWLIFYLEHVESGCLAPIAWFSAKGWCEVFFLFGCTLYSVNGTMAPSVNSTAVSVESILGRNGWVVTGFNIISWWMICYWTFCNTLIIRHMEKQQRCYNFMVKISLTIH